MKAIPGEQLWITFKSLRNIQAVYDLLYLPGASLFFVYCMTVIHSNTFGYVTMEYRPERITAG